jgi:hypothetical protein
VLSIVRDNQKQIERLGFLAATLHSSLMNALDILFKTSRFNLSKVGEHFINPCCFGEDLAAWLRIKLVDKKIKVFEPYQEDWGWELPSRYGSDFYYLCMSGNSEGRARIRTRVSGGSLLRRDGQSANDCAAKGKSLPMIQWRGLSKRFCPASPPFGVFTARSKVKCVILAFLAGIRYG